MQKNLRQNVITLFLIALDSYLQSITGFTYHRRPISKAKIRHYLLTNIFIEESKKLRHTLPTQSILTWLDRLIKLYSMPKKMIPSLYNAFEYGQNWDHLSVISGLADQLVWDDVIILILTRLTNPSFICVA